MIRIIILPIVLLLLGCSTKQEQKEDVYSLPPEWHPQESVWIDFPDESDWAGGSIPPDYPARIEIIEQLLRHVPVNVILESEKMQNTLDSMLTEENIDRTKLHVLKHPSVAGAAVRDYGPVLLTNGKDYLMTDFGFNIEGATFADSSYIARAEIDNYIADSLGYSVKPTRINSEGGGFITSNKVLLLFEEFSKLRNPEMTLQEIEKEFLDALGMEKLIWIKEPMLLDKNGHKVENTYGQGANFHMDAYLRFVNDSTILIPMINPAIKDKSTLLKADYEASLEPRTIETGNQR